MFKKTFLIFLSFVIIFILVGPIVAAKSETKYMYGTDGRLIERTDLNGTLEFEYDRNGNLTNKTGSNNLLSNSGFEANLNSEDIADGWNKYMGQGIDGSYEVITSSVAEGRKAQKISATSLPNGDGMNLWQKFFIKGSLSYNVKGMLKLANMKNAKFSVIIFFYDANNQMIGGQTPVEHTRNTADWVAFSGNFSSPVNATSARIHLHLHGTSSNAQGTIGVDGTSVTLQEDTNLLFNGGFESNKRNDSTADGWNKYMGQNTDGNYETITSSVAEGRKAQKVSATSLPGGDAMNVWQEFFIKGSLSYNVKGMLKLANMKNAKFSVIIYFYDANNQMVGGQTPVEYTRNTADWVAFSGNFSSPVNAASARIHLHLHGTSSNAQGTVGVDGTSVTLQEDNNLLFNGGFESTKRNDSTADGWNKYMGQGIDGRYEVITSSIVEGQKAQKISATALPNVEDGMNVWQEFFIKGSLSYNVKGMLKLANMKNAKFSVIIYFYDANNQMVGGQTPVEYTRNTADWAAFSGNFSSPVNAASARIHLHLHGTSSNAQGTVSTDGLSIKRL